MVSIDRNDTLFALLVVAIIAFSSMAYVDVFDASIRTPTDVASLFTPGDEQQDSASSIQGSTWFQEVTNKTGMRPAEADPSSRTIVQSGYGVYVSDYDRDGWEDVLFLGTDPVLYHNTGGRFEPIDIFSEYDGDPTQIEDAHFFDYDNDGDRDLIVSGSDKHPALFTHTEDGWDREPRRLDIIVRGPAAIASADYNDDGCLDLYFGMRDELFGFSQGTYEQIMDGKIPTDEIPDVVTGLKNRLLEGDCQGTFSEVFMGPNVRQSMTTNAVTFADLTGDGLPDIHAGNDFGQDMIYINNGDGSFTRIQGSAATARNAMSSVLHDFNHDGLPDIFVTNIHAPTWTDQVDRWASQHLVFSIEGNNVLINQGNGTFTDKTRQYNLSHGGWGWSTTITDLNNNGHTDLLHATSAGHPLPSYDRQGYDYPQLWNGTGNQTFQKHDPRKTGFRPTNGRGLVAFDYDKDGTQDIIIGSLPLLLTEGGHGREEPLILYENTIKPSDDFISIQLDYTNRLETGSTITLHTTTRDRTRWITSGSDYLSQKSQIQHFGLTDNERIQQVEITHPDGSKTTYTGLSRGHHYQLTEDGVITVRTD